MKTMAASLSTLRLAGAFALALAMTAPMAHADNGADLIKAAETAYQAVDFEKTYEAATAALKAGGHGPKEVTRLYFLIGVSGSSLRKNEEAKQAFLRMLALDPNVKAEQSLSPTLREPLLEAKGLFSGDELSAKAVLNQGRGLLVLKLSDPVAMVKKVRLLARVDPKQAFQSLDKQPSREIGVQIPGLDKSGYVEFALVLLDEHGNTLFSEGTELAPKALGELKVAGVGGTTIVTKEAPVSPLPYYITAGVLGGLGLVGGGLGVLSYLNREDKVKEWNGPNCSVALKGTRQEQCGAVDDDRKSAETQMLVFSGVGAAFLVGGAVTLALTPGLFSGKPLPTKVEVGFRCGGGPGEFGIACGGRF